MKYYFAPLEGITGYIYRNAFEKYFGSMDKYFLPFISPTVHGEFTKRELNDVLPEHNKNIKAVPQILTNNAEYFISTANELKKMGYTEINLNLGCPSGTVVSKYKGSGFLVKKKELDEFLEHIFSRIEIKISIKTRIGKDSADEFYEILDIYNKYPLEELIIHPRIQKDFYKNVPNMKMFKYGIENSKNPVCYNGDIFNKNQYNSIIEEIKPLQRIMFGRGLLGNPGLLDEIKNGCVVTKEKLEQFHNDIYLGYKEIFGENQNSLFKMKEFWFYMIHIFADSSKYAKRIRKVQKCREYEKITEELFSVLNIEKDSNRGFNSKVYM